MFFVQRPGYRASDISQSRFYDNVFLTKIEEKMLNGEMGEAVQLAARIVVKIGDALGAERLVPIEDAHISGISFKNIGESGLDFLKMLIEKEAKFAVPTTINPAGFDLKKWGKMNVDKKFLDKQREVIDRLIKIGAKPLLSCTPYEAKRLSYGQHIAWSESNAVLYANSIIGARTNREGGPLAIFEAIIGRAPYTGLHLDENRLPEVLVRFPKDGKALSPALLGYTLGFIVKKGVPYIEDFIFRKMSEIKLFLAAVGASSSIGLVLLEDVSPDLKRFWKRIKKTELEKIEITEDEIEDSRSKISKNLTKVDAFFLGCPHLSARELKEIYNFLHNKKVKERLILFTARRVIEEHTNIVNRLESKGIEVYADTCMVVSDIGRMGVRRLALDSAKAAYYLTAQGYEVVLLDREEILKIASGG